MTSKLRSDTGPLPTGDPVTVAIAGSTGSIGTQTIDVIAAQPERYRITALAAGSSLDALIAQARRIRPEFVAIGDVTLGPALADALGSEFEIGAGPDALAEVGRRAQICVNGVVGFAGLGVTLATLESGHRLALANKESLIAAGPVVQRARHTPGAELVPVDSEHAAIHMCLHAGGAEPISTGRGGEGRPFDQRRGVARLQITASGGPFRGFSRAQLEAVSVEEALKHPTWSMGPKITVDSSTLMNKGLEVIEAHELYGVPAGPHGYGLDLDDIDVVVHPQSIIHSMVTYTDGATIAQLSEPDMRLPIVYALAYPQRSPQGYGAVDWSRAGVLEFEPPDREAFVCLDLAYHAGAIGGTAPAWLSAANEVAVDAFLQGRIRWVDIGDINSTVLVGHDGGVGESLEEILEADQLARSRATAVIAAKEPR